MALAKKGTRTIAIDREVYRWVISAGDEPAFGVVVEHREKPGQRLVAWVEHGTVVKPAMVRAWILQALATGWRPLAAGPELHRRIVETDTSLSAKRACPCCDYLTLDRRGQYDICPICFWEDDGNDLARPDVHSGPNHMSLREGRANFARIGACSETAIAHVLPRAQREKFPRVER